MTARGFPPKFIRWISHLLSTSTSRVLVNGRLSPSFAHKRGLRQGDPISPYLFILAADVLQQMTAALSSLTPSTLSPKILRPAVTFQYADDTLILLSASGPTVRMMLVVIHSFSAASGLKVNLAKTSFVPLSIPLDHVQSIERLLGCKSQSLPMTYLGMPLTVKAPKRDDFSPIITKLERQLEGWKARLISRGGRLQLVKSVLSAIPTYFMSCFVFPKWLIDRIDKIRRHFLWTRNKSAPPIHLINWKTVTLPVVNGGLGVIDLSLQNTSLLLRWWWRLHASDRQLWSTYAALLYAKLPPTDGPLILSPNGSFFWKAISRIKPVFHSSVQFQMVSGKQISFWHDAWAGQPLSTDHPGPLPRRTVSLFDAKNLSHHLIRGPLTIHQSLALDSLRSFSPSPGRDRCLWNLTPSGEFSVSSIYNILTQGGKIRSTFSPIWKAKVPPSMRFFFFLLLHNRLLTHDVMERRNIPHGPGCVMCADSPHETAKHLFFLCPYALAIWDAASAHLGYTAMQPRDSPLLTYLASIPSAKPRRTRWLVTFIAAASAIWRERNARTFTTTSTAYFILAAKIQQDSALFLRHCS